MESYKDVELGEEEKITQVTVGEASDSEHATLLAGHKHTDDDNSLSHNARSLPSEHSPFFKSRVYIAVAFIAGILSCLTVQLIVCAARHQNDAAVKEVLHHLPTEAVQIYASPWVGSTEVHNFPPPSPTNAYPSLFPSNVGHAGPTPTGAEPALIETAPAYPVHTGAPHLVSPFTVGKNTTVETFDIFRHWGNLSPWFTVGRGSFGLDSSPEAPETCQITGLHLLHRHGARYPTQYGMSSLFAFQV